MTPRTVVGSSIVLLVAAAVAGGCGGRVNDGASGGIGEPPVVRTLGTRGAGGTSSAGSGVGSSRAGLGGMRDTGRGSTRSVVDAGPDAPAPLDAGRDAARLADAARGDRVEVWVGQVEHKITSLGDHGPDAPPEHVVLALFDRDGLAGGSIVFGSGPEPPKATDPNSFYPPLTPASTREEQEWQVNDMTGRPFDGQPYSLFNVHKTGMRLTFEVMPHELWKDWCSLQPNGCAVFTPSSTPEEGPDYLCLMYNHPCFCTDKSCHADLTSVWLVWLVDLEFRGDSLEGLTYRMDSGTGIWSDGVKLRRVQ